MACYGNWNSYKQVPRDHVYDTCPDCGVNVEDGVALENCEYSSTQCDTCGYSPCDERC